MITPEIAKTITEKIDGITPFFAEIGPKKGVAHVDKTYRFGRSGRHIAIVRKGTQNGVTIYMNQRSVSGDIFPENTFPQAIVTERYPMGYQGKTGDKGLSSSAARLPSINPKFNSAMRVSVSTLAEFQRVLNWYFSIKESFTVKEAERLVTDSKAAQPQAPNSSMITDNVQRTLESDTTNLSAGEREAVVKVRFGQGAFRSALLDIAGEVCWMSGIEGKELLIASHIQPWAHCEKNPDARGCCDNGLLLSSLWDAAFDAGLVTFDEDWRVLTSSILSQSARRSLGLEGERFLPGKFRNARREEYLKYHRTVVFKDNY